MRFMMKARFQPDVEARVPREPMLVDPEGYDASEQQFAASLEELSPQFVVQAHDQGESENAGKVGNTAAGEAIPVSRESAIAESAIVTPPADASQSQTLQPPDPDSWRQEVAVRLNNYRARRRPREPRYPSLQLKFDSSEPAWSAHVSAHEPRVPQPATRSAVALEAAHLAPAILDAGTAERLAASAPAAVNPPETTARIIPFPFPRSANAPPRPLEELAGPVPDRPRILEVPEVAPLPPALGGILIESMEEPVNDRRPGFEIPLQAARLSPRLVAAVGDGALVLIAVAMAGWIFFRMAAPLPPARQLAAITVVVAGIFWFGYQYLLLVYTGTTPGLKLARLRLSRFDGSTTPRGIRRWRVLASALSGVSLGLGYAWCALDEDQLCWHDRITKTYLAPEVRANAPKVAQS
jgi:uncharacterized RDD family membrane protein YckC